MEQQEWARSVEGAAAGLAGSVDGSLWGPGSPPGDPALAEEELAIRLPRGVGWDDCVDCEVEFRVAGPTGYLGVRPICDTCVLERSEGLGALLMLGTAVRSFAGFAARGRSEKLRALDELAAVARVYERLTQRFGPPRSFLILGALHRAERNRAERNGEQHRAEPGRSDRLVEDSGEVREE